MVSLMEGASLRPAGVPGNHASCGAVGGGKDGLVYKRRQPSQHPKPAGPFGRCNAQFPNVPPSIASACRVTVTRGVSMSQTAIASFAKQAAAPAQQPHRRGTRQWPEPLF